MKLSAYLFTTCLLFAANSQAQVYKCTSVDDETHQNKVIYTDTPCGKAAKQTLTSIQTKSEFGEQNLQSAKLAQANALDEAVARAVLHRDFKQAKSLAKTKEHWRLIAIAEQEPVPQPIVVAENNQVALRQENECAEARENFESVSLTSSGDKALLAAKKSVMYAACGVSEPVHNQPLYIGYGYGGHGLHRGHGDSRLNLHAPIAPNFRGGSHIGASGSLNYRSKNFGINARGFNAR